MPRNRVQQGHIACSREEAVRGFVLFLCVVSSVACHKKTAPPPVAPMQQPTSTGSGDRDRTDSSVAADIGSKETPPPGRSTFGPICYAYDSADLDDKARSELGALGDFMGAQAASRVQISGHTDERGTTEYNLALGERRARSAKEYLQRLGVAAARIDTISYGEERPAAEGSEERSWGLNRRCELRLADR